VPRNSGLSPSDAHARDRVIRTAIGQMLAAQYDLAEPLSEGLESLLTRFENVDEVSAVDIAHTRMQIGIGSRSVALPAGAHARTARSRSNRGSKR
jgi:hypothetical protein